MMIAIMIATAGVLVMSYKPGGMTGGIKPTLVGLASGAMFAISAIGYRGAILNVSAGHFVMAATFTLACGLVLQAALLTAYLALRDRPVLVAIAAQWRRSLFAGFMGAFASQFWFLAFAIATAASVRTLALVEVLFAQAISAFIFKQKTSPREARRHGDDRGRRDRADLDVTLRKSAGAHPARVDEKYTALPP